MLSWNEGWSLCSQNFIDVMQRLFSQILIFTCDTYGGRREVHRVLVWKPEETRPLERSRLTWEDDIKMDLKEREGEIVGGIYQGKDMRSWLALLNSVMNFRVP